MIKSKENSYKLIMASIFEKKYEVGKEEFLFKRTDISEIAASLNIKLPKNLGDVIIQYREDRDVLAMKEIDFNTMLKLIEEFMNG